MEKLDLTKKLKSCYTARKKPELVYIDKAHFLSLAGKGDPSDSLFAEKIQALYSTAYTVKFICKGRGTDFAVPKLEGLWWFDDDRYRHVSMTDAPSAIPRSEWEYRLLIRMPDFVSNTDVKAAVESVWKKKGLPHVNDIELFELTEGKCVQMLHVGPFNTEPESLKEIQAFSLSNNLARNGLHHEIYLSDFRKTPAAKLRTILREPVK